MCSIISVSQNLRCILFKSLLALPLFHQITGLLTLDFSQKKTATQDISLFSEFDAFYGGVGDLLLLVILFFFEF